MISQQTTVIQPGLSTLLSIWIESGPHADHTTLRDENVIYILTDPSLLTKRHKRRKGGNLNLPSITLPL